MTTGSALLEQLKDTSKCDDALAATVRQTLLEPFQPPLSASGPTKRQPTQAQFQSMTNRLSPLAVKILQQNTETLKRLKSARTDSHDYSHVVQCLVDTSSYAIAALRHMKTCSQLRPLDIEKLTSNMICKIVDLEEYARALQEIQKQRTSLARVANIELKTMPSVNKKPNLFTDKSFDPRTSNKSPLRETQNHRGGSEPPAPVGSPTASLRAMDIISLPAQQTQWEDDTIRKYGDLFLFPLDATIVDRSMILLVLSYQMNLLRSWSSINRGALLKHLPRLFDRPGNFIDWCEHLMTIDEKEARTQYDLLYRQFIRSSSKATAAGSHLLSFVFQIFALKASRYLPSSSVRDFCHRLVHVSGQYEKTGGSIEYKFIHKTCNELLETIEVHARDQNELEAYCLLCEYTAYAARKAGSSYGQFTAYTQILRPLRPLLEKPDQCNYYQATYVANAKLAMTSTHLSQVSAVDAEFNVTSILEDLTSYLHLAKHIAETHPDFGSSGLYASNALCKSISRFQESARNLWILICKYDSGSSRQHPKGDGSADLGVRDETAAQLVPAIKLCMELLTLSLTSMQKKTLDTESRRKETLAEVMLAYTSMAILQARLVFRPKSRRTHQEAQDYLTEAERLSTKVGYTGGNRYIADAFQMIGVSLFNQNLYEDAIYPLRKCCTLLEHDKSTLQSDTGRLHLSKRYESWGVCCQKAKMYEVSVKAFRLALRRLPRSSIDAFVKELDTLSAASLAEANPVIPKLMERFMRVNFIDNEDEEGHFASGAMDLSHLDGAKRCLVHEYELKILTSLSARRDCSVYQSILLETLLSFYTQRHFPVRRARTLLELIRIELSQGYAPSAMMPHIKEIQSLLGATEFGHDGALLTYRRHYLALCSSWESLCKPLNVPGSSRDFKIPFHHWAMLLKDVEPIYSGPTPKPVLQKYRETIDGANSLYLHLCMLSDYFAANRQIVYEICTLRLMLKLNNGLRSVPDDYISASIILSSRIGRLYSDLGYSGRAALEFSDARRALEARTCSNEAKITYYLYYALHLIRIGNIEKSELAFNTAHKAWDAIMRSEADQSLGMHRYESPSLSAAHRMLLADAYLVRSMLSLKTHSLEAAIQDGAAASRLLTWCRLAIDRKLQERDETLTNTTVENPFTNEQPSAEARLKQSDHTLASGVTFKESRWTVAWRISHCVRHVAQLHMTEGSWRDAEYYLQKGRELNEDMETGLMLLLFLVSLSDYHLRKGEMEESKNKILAAAALEPSEGPLYTFEKALWKMAVGDVDMAQNCTEDAIRSFKLADQYFAALQSQRRINTVEHPLDCSGEEDTMDASLAKVVRNMDAEQRDQRLYNCAPLLCMQATNTIRIALAKDVLGSPSSGLELLQKLRATGSIAGDEIEIQACIVYLKLRQVQRELAKRKRKELCDEALMLPSMKTQLPSQPHQKSSLSADLRPLGERLDRVLEYVWERRGTIAAKAQVRTLSESYASAGYMSIVINNLLRSSVLDNYPIVSSYYFEMAKGITTRREMRACLASKLNPLALKSIDEHRWPPASTAKTDTMEIDAKPIHLLSRTRPWLEPFWRTLHDLYSTESQLSETEFQSKYIDIIPDNWTVCSIAMDTRNSHLYVNRMRAGETPLILKLPLHRARNQKLGKQVQSFSDSLAEFHDIIRSSDETIQQGEQYSRANDVKGWWEKRHRLDQRLRALLYRIQDDWFGGWKAVLCGRFYEHAFELRQFQQDLNMLLQKTLGASNNEEDAGTVSLTLCRVILQLGYQHHEDDIEDVVWLLSTNYPECGLTAGSNAMEEIKRKLSAAIKRYHEASKKAGVQTMERLPGDHVIFIPDKHMQVFPLESMKVLRSQAVSRLPSLSLLRDRILYSQASHGAEHYDIQKWRDITINRKSTYYVLNPGGDLSATQTKFEASFKSKEGWQGVVNTKPTEAELQRGLAKHDLYMYFGHSAGQGLIRPQRVRALEQGPVAILMGCSSGRLRSQGEFDPTGPVIDYLMNGSPAVVANLWDVTDVSIDSLAQEMLNGWGLLKDGQTSTSLVEAVAAARNACRRLRYLIGAAAVVYGVPVYIQN